MEGAVSILLRTQGYGRSRSPREFQTYWIYFSKYALTSCGSAGAEMGAASYMMARDRAGPYVPEAGG